MTCPECGSPRVRPSHRRSPWERIRSRLTGRRPYRCRACQWRGWLSLSALRADLTSWKPQHQPLGEKEFEAFDDFDKQQSHARF